MILVSREELSAAYYADMSARGILKPVPQMFATESLSRKKSRPGSENKFPLPPPLRSPDRSGSLQACPTQPQAVSFNGSEGSFHSQHYDSSRPELYLHQCFHVDSKLGQGSFGVVYKVRSREDGRWYAVKEAHRQFRSMKDRQDKLQEVAKHECLPPHPNCVRFIKAWEENFRLYIQMELCHSNMTAYAEEHHDIPERAVWNYLVDLLQGLKHLHDHNLIHLDIKPDNIFISNEGLCKLGDFGLVVRLDSAENRDDPVEGDARYMAPELMDGDFTKAADVFSLGITILELACDLELPGQGEHWHSLRTGTLPADVVTDISPDLRDLVQRMMHPDPIQRITVDQLLAHPRIREVLRWRRLYAARKRAVTWVFELFLLLWLWICRMARKLLPRRSSWLPLWWLNPKGLPHRDKSFEDSFSDDDTFEDSFHSLGTSLNDSRHGTTVFPHISSTPKPLRANASQRFCSTPWLDSPQRPPSRSRLSNQLEDTWFDMEPKNLFQSFEELAAESSPDL